MVLWFEKSSEFQPEDLSGFIDIIRQLDEAFRKWAEDNKPKSKPTIKDRKPPARPAKRRKGVNGKLPHNSHG